jgi:glycosyltransferase involved in cell wall biosynthesis
MDALVTIVITSYNYGAHLGDAIRSALAQTYRNVEVLVLDNASTDNSVEVIESFHDERLRAIVRAENIGIQRNHNDGFRQARGEYVVFLSADDVMLPTLVADVLEYRRAHPGVDMVYASVAITDKTGRIQEYFDHPSFDAADTYHGRNELASLLTRDNNMYLPTMLFPKSLIEEVGMLDESLNVLLDYDQGMRIAGAGKKFGFFSKPEALIRFHGENRSGSTNFVQSGGQLREFCTLLERYTQPKYHEQLAGYGAELIAMVNTKIAEMATQFPQAFEERRAELEPYANRAMASIKTVPSIGPSVLRGEGLISVVIPFSGRIGPLQRALESLAASDYARWEAVVVADGAIDPSALIDSMGLGDRVRVTRCRRGARGPGAIRNVGLMGINGEIVAYLDDDNRFEPGYLRALAEAFANPATMVTVGKARSALVDAGGNERRIDDVGLGTMPDGRVSFVSNRLALNAVAHRRSCLPGTGLFHRGLTILEDWEFLIRLNRAFTFTRIDVPACVVCVDITLRGHHVFGRKTAQDWTEFVARVRDIYAAYPHRDEFERVGRENYVNSLQTIIQSGINSAGNPDQVAAFVRSLAGPRAADGVSAG